jgi:hypothetical protein
MKKKMDEKKKNLEEEINKRRDGLDWKEIIDEDMDINNKYYN